MLGVVTLLTWWCWTDTAAADEGSDGDVLGIDLPVDSPVDLEPVDQLVTTVENTVSPVVLQAAEPASAPVVAAAETVATVADPAVTTVNAAGTAVSGTVAEAQPLVGAAVGAVQEQSPVPLPAVPPLPSIPALPAIPSATPEPGDALVTPVSTFSTIATTSTDATGPSGPASFLTTQRARAAESLVGLPAIATNHATRRFEGRSHYAALPEAMDGAIGWQDAASTPAAAPATAPPALPPPAAPRSSGIPPGGGSLELPERGPLASVLAAAAVLAAIQLATRLRALEMALTGITGPRPSFTPD